MMWKMSYDTIKYFQYIDIIKKYLMTNCLKGVILKVAFHRD